ncbi:restriction endonuclease subunit S [Methylocystis sp. JAN1]|uniref:restriction endonuclease subunit S n=1 Tax=Methylocystis sp. JAN1 TaxID=3397211 RepID=UPI003FA1FF75
MSGDSAWPLTKIGDLIRESRIKGSNGSSAKKLTIRLYGRGVVASADRGGSEATNYFIRRAGQFAYSKLDCLNGAFGIIPEHLDGYETTLDLPAFDFVGKVDPDWFLKTVARPSFYGRFKFSAIGSRKANRVPVDEFLATRLSIPPLAEQRAIAEALGAVEMAIAKTEVLIDTISQTQTSLIKSYFHQRQKTLRWSRIGKAGRWLSGGTPATATDGNWDGDIPWVCPKDIKAPTISSTIDNISQDAAKQIGIVEPGTLLLVVRGMILARAVPSTISTVRCAFNQDVKAFVPNKSMQPRFLKLWLDINEHKLLGEIETATHGTKRFPLERLNAFPVPVLSPKEQDKIVALAQSGYDRLASERQFLSSLQAVRVGLAQELLSGRLRLPASIIARHRNTSGRAA